VFVPDLDSSRFLIEDPSLCEVGRDDMPQADTPELRGEVWYVHEENIGVGYRIDGCLVVAK
jgi:hypothetical protein